jgi:predicted permease
MKNKEATIEQKEKAFTKEAVILDCVVFVVLMYFNLTVSAYLSEHPKENIADALSAAFPTILSSPLYFIPINYDALTPFCVAVVFVLFLFVMQTMNYMRLHHNVNTLKGRTHWADFNDILEKYADYDEE